MYDVPPTNKQTFCVEYSRLEHAHVMSLTLVKQTDYPQVRLGTQVVHGIDAVPINGLV